MSLVALAAVVYAGDYVALRLRAAYPRLGKAFGAVQMERLYAIPLKNGGTEYEMDAQLQDVFGGQPLTRELPSDELRSWGKRPGWGGRGRRGAGRLRRGARQPGGAAAGP